MINIAWQTTLKKLEDAKQWDEAIAFMQKIIENNPHDKDAYIAMNYLIMNLLVEEDYNVDKHDDYATLSKKYFNQSYAQFSEDPEYLFYTGMTGAMSEWYFGIEMDDIDKMLLEAIKKDPSNQLYRWTEYPVVLKDGDDLAKTYKYADYVLQPNSPIRKLLKKKGSLGEYILRMIEHWSKRMIKECQHSIKN